MGKVLGHIKFTGTVDRLCFYKMGGEYYVRKASSLTGKRVKKDKKFQLTMVYADLLARASRIASKVYRELPKTFRQYWMFRAFTGEALGWLKQGKSDEEVTVILMKTYAEVWVKKEEVIEESKLSRKEKPLIRLQKTIRVGVFPFLISPATHRKYNGSIRYHRCGKHIHSPPVISCRSNASQIFLCLQPKVLVVP